MHETPPIDLSASLRLDDRVAIVTGASSGLGARFAQVLDAMGARVAIAARRRHRLDELAASLTDPIVVEVDLLTDGASHRLVEQVYDAAGRVDVVVANAGTSQVKPATKETPEEMNHVIGLDLVVPFQFGQAAVDKMRLNDEGGVIINIASAAGVGSNSMLPQASYVAAKTGLIGLTRELAAQWARYGVRVNALCPGMFPSELTSALVDDPQLREPFEQSIPMRRVGRSDELDAALAFLASPASSYMTGQALVVDGGATCVR